MLPLLTRHPVDWESFFSILLDSGTKTAQRWEFAAKTLLPAQGIAQLARGGQSPPRTPQQKSELTWSGEIPSQKWMNFYTKFLTKLGVGNGLTLTVKVESRPEGGLSPQRLEEIRSALRELRLGVQPDPLTGLAILKSRPEIEIVGH